MFMNALFSHNFTSSSAMRSRIGLDLFAVSLNSATTSFQMEAPTFSRCDGLREEAVG